MDVENEETKSESTEKKKTNKTKKIIIIIISVIVILGGGFLAYLFIYIPSQVTAYRNDVIDVHNAMVSNVDQMNVITDQINEGSSDPEALDQYVALSDQFASLTSDLESIDQVERNNDALKNFNTGVDELIATAKEAEQVERDIALIMREMALFFQCGEELVVATASANPEEPSTFDTAFSDYDEGMKKCDNAVHNLNSAPVSSNAEDARIGTVDYFTKLKKAYEDMKTALEKSKTAIDQNNYNLSLEAVNDIEDVGERLENTTWPEPFTELLTLEGQAVDALNASFDSFAENDDALIKEYGISEE